MSLDPDVCHQRGLHQVDFVASHGPITSPSASFLLRRISFLECSILFGALVCQGARAVDHLALNIGEHFVLLGGRGTGLLSGLFDRAEVCDLL